MQIERYFGIRVTVAREFKLSNFKALEPIIKGFIARRPPDAKEPKVYVHRLLFTIKDRHFQTDGLSERLRSLKVAVRVPPRQRERDRMELINCEIMSPLTPGIKTAFGKYQNRYVLDADFITQNSLFEDYAVTLVENDVPKSQRKLRITLSAAATQAFGPRIHNIDPMSIQTTLTFNLVPAVQFVLDLNTQPALEPAAANAPQS